MGDPETGSQQQPAGPDDQAATPDTPDTAGTQDAPEEQDGLQPEDDEGSGPIYKP